MLDVCISLKAFPWRQWPVWFLTFPSKKAKKGYFQPFITFIEYSCRERKPTLFILGGLRTLSRAALCALQRAALNSGEICWKCLENSRPCSPMRAPSIIGLAVSLCSLAATLSTHKSLLPNSALLLRSCWLPLLLCTSLLPPSTLHLPAFFLFSSISTSSLCLHSSVAHFLLQISLLSSPSYLSPHLLLNLYSCSLPPVLDTHKSVLLTSALFSFFSSSFIPLTWSHFCPHSQFIVLLPSIFPASISTRFYSHILFTHSNSLLFSSSCSLTPQTCFPPHPLQLAPSPPTYIPLLYSFKSSLLCSPVSSLHDVFFFFSLALTFSTHLSLLLSLRSC